MPLRLIAPVLMVVASPLALVAKRPHKVASYSVFAGVASFEACKGSDTRNCVAPADMAALVALPSFWGAGWSTWSTGTTTRFKARYVRLRFLGYGQRVNVSELRLTGSPL